MLNEDFNILNKFQGVKLLEDLNKNLKFVDTKSRSFVENIFQVKNSIEENKKLVDPITNYKEIYELLNENYYNKLERQFNDEELFEKLREISEIVNRIRVECVNHENFQEILGSIYYDFIEKKEKFNMDYNYVFTSYDDSSYVGEAEYLSDLDILVKNGTGILLEENGNIYFGKFKQGYFIEGTFLKREKDETWTFYGGKFLNIENPESAKFIGVSIPTIKKEKKLNLVCFDGEIQFSTNSFNGTFLFQINSESEGEKIEIYQGEMINGRKEGKNTTLIAFSNLSEINSNYSISIQKFDYSNGSLVGKGFHYNIRKSISEYNFYKQTKRQTNFIKCENNTIPYFYIGSVQTNINDGSHMPNTSDGKLIFSNGDLYFGALKNGIKEGKGRQIQKDSADELIICDGIFENNHIKDGKIYLGKNLVYDGLIENNSMKSGKFYFKEGETNFYYEGLFDQRKRNGIGLNVYSDNSSYRGDWKNDERHGNGSYEYSDKFTRYKGDWNRNIKEGCATLKNDLVEIETKWENNKLDSLLP